MADDSLATVTDWLGRDQPLARKSLDLTTSGGGAAVTAPVTPSAQERAQAVSSIMREVPPTPAGSTAQEILAGLQTARSAAGQIAQFFPAQQPSLAVPAGDTPTVGPQVTPGEQAGVGFGNTPPTQILQGPATPGAAPTVSPNVTPGEAAGAGFEGAGGGIESGAGAGEIVGGVLPYLGAALSISQDALSNKPNAVKGVDAAFDLAGAILAPYTYGLSAVASSFAKADLDRLIPDVQHGDVLRAMFVDTIANPITLVSDIIQLFGGPDLTKNFFLESPGHHWGRARHGAVNEANQYLSGLADSYRAVTDVPSALTALQQRHGAVGSSLQLPTEIATWLGLPISPNGNYNWSQLDQQGFQRLLGYFAQSPERLDQAVIGSGDVPYLPGEVAQQVGDNAAQLSRSLLGAFVNAIRGAPSQPLEPRTAPPVTAQGPAGALGFATDLLAQT